MITNKQIKSEITWKAKPTKTHEFKSSQRRKKEWTDEWRKLDWKKNPSNDIHHHHHHGSIQRRNNPDISPVPLSATVSSICVIEGGGGGGRWREGGGHSNGIGGLNQLMGRSAWTYPRCIQMRWWNAGPESARWGANGHRRFEMTLTPVIERAIVIGGCVGVILPHRSAHEHDWELKRLKRSWSVSCIIWHWERNGMNRAESRRIKYNEGIRGWNQTWKEKPEERPKTQRMTRDFRHGHWHCHFTWDGIGGDLWSDLSDFGLAACGCNSMPLDWRARLDEDPKESLLPELNNNCK